ncbi:unnamed protein product [Heterobilharzia americana]|nr:unnamed protein product [Heterobilharzia americana]
MGSCKVNSDGHCYTARAINIDALGRYLRSKVNSEADSLTMNVNPTKLNRFIHVVYGCLDSHDKTILACNSHLTKHAVPQAIECCNSSNMCNTNLFPKFLHHNTDMDALKTAFEHLEKSNILGRESAANGNLRLKPHMNVGPDMLIGGSARGSLAYDKLRKNYLWGQQLTPENRAQYLFHVVLIVTFSLVFVVLFLVLASVCCVYKRRAQKRKLNLSVSNTESSVFRLSGAAVVCDAKFMNRLPHNKCFKTTYPVPAKFDRSSKVKDGSSPHTLMTDLTHNFGSSIIEKSHYSTDPLSRSGLLHLIPQTVARQITLDSLLGVGRFSDVWTGNWKGERVVAKVFRTNDRLTRNIWHRVVLLHRSMLLRHQGVHGLMAVDWLDYPTEAHLSKLKRYFSDSLPKVTSPCALLVGEICVYGTLKDLFSHGDRILNSFSQPQDSADPNYCCTTSTTNDWFSIMHNPGGVRLRMLLEVANSLVQGLCFLHSEFAGTRGKPALAHRDLKPSNIYIRSDWSCCIGDIGLAVRSPPCPFPVSMDRLYTLYKHYADYSTKYSHFSNQCSEIPTSERLGSDFPFEHNSVHTTQKEPLMVSNHMDRSYDSCNQNTGTCNKWDYILEDPVDKSRFDRLELLNWWPIGGIQIGTPRYLAPELLAKSINPFCFESYQKSDIYALSLILWEVVSWALPKSIWSDQHFSNVSHIPDCASSRRQSSVDSMSLTNSNSSLVSKLNTNGYSSVYSPVYQNEWLKLLKCTMNFNDGYEIVKSSSDLLNCPMIHSCYCSDDILNRSGYMYKTNTSRYLANKILVDEQLKNNEPDLKTMYHLVCEQQIRPHLPSLSFPVNINDAVKTVEYYSQHTQSFCHNMMTHVVQLHNDSTVDVIRANDELAPTVCRECSSSGASSLQSNHTNLDGDSKQSNNHIQLRIMKLQYLVASQFALLLPECWSDDPDSRLSALRIKKRIQRIYELIDSLVNKSSIYTDVAVNTESGKCQSIAGNLRETCTNESSTLVNRT